MEDVLEVYTRPYDRRFPQVCLDELSKQLVEETRTPHPMRPGSPARYDTEYRRNGVRNVFVVTEPLRGWRCLEVTERRTRADWAEFMRTVADVHYPEAERIIVVLDNLNTHGPASFYEAFAPAEARRLTQRFEFHYTPKHGSWLNMAEIEFAVVSTQCVDRRLGDQERVRRVLTAWETGRHAAKATVDWQFTTANARRKLKWLYPL